MSLSTPTDLRSVDHPRRKRVGFGHALGRAALRAIDWLLGLALLLGSVGLVLRDRVPALFFLIYIPLAPLAVLALLWDLARLGRALRRVVRVRFGMSAVCALVIAYYGWFMVGHSTDATPAQGPAVTLVQWNTQAGNWMQGIGWEATMRRLIADGPDVIVFNEMPQSAERIRELCGRLGPTWKWTRFDVWQGTWQYRSDIAVLSRWPIKIERKGLIHEGCAIGVTLQQPGRPVRLLVVDGLSRPRLKTPFIASAGEWVAAAAAEGRPYDLICGDFNATRASTAFDAFLRLGPGYKEASAYSRDWRGTWPWVFPLYDIDHVFVASPDRVDACELFTTQTSDHRGQVVRVKLGG